MEIPLNAMDAPHPDDDDDAPPAFTIPMRGTAVSLSSLLSSESDHDRERSTTPQPLHAHFPADVAPIALPAQQAVPPQAATHRPRVRGGLSALMNSPMDDDVLMQDPRGYATAEPSSAITTPTPIITSSSSRTNDTRSSDTNSTAVPAAPYQQQMTPASPAEPLETAPLSAAAPHKMDVDGDAAVASPRSTSDSPVPLLRQRKGSVVVEINVQSVVLNDAELERLKSDFQLVVQKYLAIEARGESSGPAAKRQKKGKHARGKAKTAPQLTTDESLAEVHKCIERLHRRVRVQCESPTVLTEVVRFCLTFCAVLHEKDAIDKVVVLKQTQTPTKLKKTASPQTSTSTSPALDPRDIDLDATLAALAHKPLYFLLFSVVRRTVLTCSSDDVARALLSQVLAWCRATASPVLWTWLLAFIGETNAFATLEFLVHDLVFGDATAAESAAVVPVVEFLVAQQPAQLVDMVRDLVDACAAEGVREIHGKSVAWVVQRLVALATEHPVFVRVCDDSLQFFVTRELVERVAANVDAAAHASEATLPSLSSLLLQLLEKRSTELQCAGFQLLLLLHELAWSATGDAASDEELPLAAHVALGDAATTFHAQVLAFAEREEPPSTFLRSVHRFLPFIAQSALQSLQSASTNEKKGGCKLAFEHWRPWLELLARRVSVADVTQHAIDADLMLSEGPGGAITAAAAAAYDQALGCLLARILTPLSAHYVAFIEQLMASCTPSAPRVRQRRVLALLQTLLHGHVNSSAHTRPQHELPIDVRLTNGLGIESPLAQLVHVGSWSARWQQFELWRGTQGVQFWERFIDLATSRDAQVAARALDLAAQTPFASLEDPSWQYRGLHKLTTAFFRVLRQYRSELVVQSSATVSSGDSARAALPATQARLILLQGVLVRLLALDGGVAHYASSVFTTFASLWLDALFRTASATSIPTHFPDRVNHSLDSHSDGHVTGADHDRVVIRSERTISAKCTNLQASQVLTSVGDTLVYRKALDATWASEMNAAHACSLFATDVLQQLLVRATALSTAPSSTAAAATERKLTAVVDLLLERALPCCGVPSDDVYKETLPNRSSADVDLRIEQWLHHFPAFLPLLRTAVATAAAIGSRQSLRLVPLVKAALVVLLGHWHSVQGELARENMDVPPYMRNRHQLALTCELVRILRLTGWLPPPLGRTAELLPLTSPADIRAILLSCWFYLSDHPPTAESTTPAASRAASPTSAASSPSASAAAGGMSANSHAHVPLEFYLVPLRKALHANMRKIGAKYPLFMC